MNPNQFVSLPEMAEIRNDLRKPINSTEREKRISGKPQSKLYPYYGATGQVGMIDSYLSDGEYVLVGEDGAPFLDITKSKAYLISGKGWVNNHAHVLQAKKQKSTNRFLLHYLNYFNYEGFVSGTTRLKLTKGKLEQIPVPNFSFEEQIKIADNIDTLFAKVDNASKELGTAKTLVSTYKQSILNSAIRGKLVPQNPKDEPASKLLEKIKKEKEKLTAEKKIKKEKPLPPISEDEIPFEIPDSWQWCRFSDIAIVKSNLVSPDKYKEYPHIAPDNIEKATGKLLEYRTIAEDNVKSPKHLFYPGQIIYSKIRPYLSKLIIVNFEGLCSADMYPIETHLDTEYLFYYMLSSTFLSYASNSGTRTVLPKINQEELSQIPVPVPPLNEQKRIIVKLKQAQEQCLELSDIVSENLKKSYQLKQSILKKAFEGKL